MAFALPSQAATLREQEIIDLVTNAVVARQQVQRRDVQVVWQDMDANVLVPALPPGHVTLEVPPAAHLGGRSSVPIQIIIDGRKFRTIFPRLDVQIFQTVLIATDRIPRGTLADRSMVSVERRSVTNVFQPPITKVDSILGAESTRDIPAGTILTAQMFRLPTIIKSGDPVTITLTSGGLTVIYTGEARSAGAMGQLIKVVNLDSKKEFAARVTGPNQVEVKLED